MEATQSFPWRMGCMLRRTLPGKGPAAVLTLTDDFESWSWRLRVDEEYRLLAEGRAPSPTLAMIHARLDAGVFAASRGVEFGPWETVTLWGYHEGVFASVGYQGFDPEDDEWDYQLGPCMWGLRSHAGWDKPLVTGECTSIQLGKHAAEAAWRQHLRSASAA